MLLCNVLELSNAVSGMRRRENFAVARRLDFPLPSTGRGIESEGSSGQEASEGREQLAVSTPHPGRPPVEGRGRTSFSKLPNAHARRLIEPRTRRGEDIAPYLLR